MSYRRYPEPGPSRRTVRLLIVLTLLLLIANLGRQGGMW